jgi:menaquinone-dependent protoporphyrinogen IX oxidase
MSKGAIVVYTSKYGTTKQYAAWIAEALDADLVEAKTVKPEMLRQYPVVVYGGGLYAGGIAGVKLVTKAVCKNLVVFTVGLADPETTDYSAIIQRSFTPELARKTALFHLRGGMDYKKLGPVHSIMMSMMQGMIRRKAPSEQNAENQEFLATYGKTVSFLDKKSIEPIVSHVRKILDKELKDK